MLTCEQRYTRIGIAMSILYTTFVSASLHFYHLSVSFIHQAMLIYHINCLFRKKLRLECVIHALFNAIVRALIHANKSKANLVNSTLCFQLYIIQL